MDNIIISFAVFGTIILTILKLVDAIDWSWLYITSPASVTLLIVVFFTTIKAFNEATSTETKIDFYIKKKEKRTKSEYSKYKNKK